MDEALRIEKEVVADLSQASAQDAEHTGTTIFENDAEHTTVIETAFVDQPR